MEQKRFDGFTATMIAMLGLAAVTIYFGMDYKPISRFLPIAASILLVACVVWLMYDRSKGGDANEKTLSGEGDEMSAAQIWQSILWISVFAAMAYTVGFIFGSAIYAFASLYFFGKRSLRHSLFVSVGLGVLVFVLFDLVLGKTLYEGIFVEMLLE